MKELKRALGVRNNGEANFTATCSHSECDKTFTSAVSQDRADLALRMHVGRKHSRAIVRAAETGNGKLTCSKHRSKLSSEDVGKLVDYIRDHAHEYDSKVAVVRAAVANSGIEGHLKVSSTTTDRYYRKAMDQAPEPKRKYARRAPPKTVEQHVSINFCPQCGCNIHAIATGMALASQLK